MKYGVLNPIKFSPYYNSVALDHISLLQKTMDIFYAKFSDTTFCHLPGSVILDLLLHIMSWYASVSSGGEHKNSSLTCHNDLVDCNISSLFEIIKLEENEVNNEF